MSVDLLSDAGGEFWFSNSGWRHLVAFAEKHGFIDQSTEDDRASAEDARRLADAVERGMGAGSSEELAERCSRELTQLLVMPASALFNADPIRLDERSVEHWKKFIEFARRDGFSISY